MSLYKVGIFLLFLEILSINNSQGIESDLDKVALANFIEYLKIPTVNSSVISGECMIFFKKIAKSLNLPIRILELVSKKPIVIITWKGIEPEKPSILLNGHMDVVSVIPNNWKYPPFDAVIDKNGNIYARGSQDMKGISIQEIEAIRRLKLDGIRLKRTVHLSFMPDEETGGIDGMREFVKTQDFNDLNVGFALDEGNVSPDNRFPIYYGEKTVFRCWINCSGVSGHGSNLIKNTAGEKLRFIIDRLMDFRDMELKRLDENPGMDEGNITSINLTMLKGGNQINVIPNQLSAAFDIRIAPGFYDKFKKLFNEWIKEAGNGVSYTIINSDLPIENTKLDESNIYWMAFKKFFDDNYFKVKIMINPAASDSRYLRDHGIPALGFSPNINTPKLYHDNNEFLNKDVFLRGISVYMGVIKAIANI